MQDLHSTRHGIDAMDAATRCLNGLAVPVSLSTAEVALWLPAGRSGAGRLPADLVDAAARAGRSLRSSEAA